MSDKSCQALIPRRSRGLQALVWLVVAAAAMTSGCNVLAWTVHVISPSRRGKTVPAEFDGLRGHSVAVVIDADPAVLFEHRYLRVELGTLINAGLREHVKGVRPVAPQRVTRYQRENIQWDAMAPSALGEALGADFVLLLSVLEHSMREPGSASLLLGRVSAEAGLYDVSLPAGRQRVWHSAEIGATHPADGRPVQYVPDEREFRHQTQRRFAVALVRKFYSHKVKTGQ